MAQELIYIPERQKWVVCPNRPHIFAYLLPGAKHIELPVTIQHFTNVIIEDRGHDYQWQDGKIKYCGHGENVPGWFLIEYES